MRFFVPSIVWIAYISKTVETETSLFSDTALLDNLIDRNFSTNPSQINNVDTFSLAYLSISYGLDRNNKHNK